MEKKRGKSGSEGLFLMGDLGYKGQVERGCSERE